jgi:hypothetical protein
MTGYYLTTGYLLIALTLSAYSHAVEVEALERGRRRARTPSRGERWAVTIALGLIWPFVVAMWLAFSFADLVNRFRYDNEDS